MHGENGMSHDQRKQKDKKEVGQEGKTEIRN